MSIINVFRLLVHGGIREKTKEDVMADPVKITASTAIQSAVIRVLRLLVAQLPALIAWAQGTGVNPQYIAYGVALNGLFKVLRDLFPGWIVWVPL